MSTSVVLLLEEDGVRRAETTASKGDSHKSLLLFGWPCHAVPHVIKTDDVQLIQQQSHGLRAAAIDLTEAATASAASPICYSCSCSSVVAAIPAAKKVPEAKKVQRR